MGLGSSFWRLLGSSSTSNLADGVALVAMPLLAASLTRDPVQISALQALAYLPWLLLAVPGGALVDRVDRRLAMGTGNAIRGSLFVALAVLVATDHFSIWVIYVAVLLFGTVEVLYDSAARAILPQVLGKHDLDRGNAYLTVGEVVGNQFAGAPLGAFLFAAVAWSPILGSGTAYLVAGGLVLSVRGDFRVERAARTTLRADIREGLRWLRGHRFLRSLTLSAGWFGLMQAMVNGVLVLYALERLGLKEAEFGLFVIAAAAGSVAGGLSAPRVSDRLGRGTALVAATLTSPICLVGMGLTSSTWAAALFFALSAGGVTVWNVLSMSLRQALIPPELFGRVLGIYRTVIWGAIPVGAMAGGVLADLTDLGTVFVVAGLGQLVSAVWNVGLMREHRAAIA